MHPFSTLTQETEWKRGGLGSPLNPSECRNMPYVTSFAFRGGRRQQSPAEDASVGIQNLPKCKHCSTQYSVALNHNGSAVPWLQGGNFQVYFGYLYTNQRTLKLLKTFLW